MMAGIHMRAGGAIVAVFLLLSAASAVAADVDFTRIVQPFLKQHCFDCHGAEKQKANIRYDQLSGFSANDRALWTMVHEQLKSGAMPPEERAQPSAIEKNKLLAWIEREQQALRANNTRRLNRRELNAALQDLTGRAVDFAYALPEDGKVAGFDTGADALQDTADSVVQMLEVARRAVEGVSFLQPHEPNVLLAELRNHKDPRRVFDSWKKEGASVKARGINHTNLGLLLEPEWLGDRGGLTMHVPPPTNQQGVLRLKVSVSVLKGAFAGIPNPHLWVEIGGQTLLQKELPDTTNHPIEFTFEAQAEDLLIEARGESRGIAVNLHNVIEVPYSVEGFANDERDSPEKPVPGGTGLFRPKWDKKTKAAPEQQPFPFIAVHRVEIDREHVAAWPPAAWNRAASPTTDSKTSAQQLIALWTERAWRRPVKDAELKPFLALYDKRRVEGSSFDDAMRAACQSVLLSAPFRYLDSPFHKDPTVAQHAIASRLSFMLNGAPPDSELRALAAAGKLKNPDVLSAQVDRLLSSPSSDAFVRPFVTQWLEMGQPITLAMENIQKQDHRFGRNLKASMQAETVAYFARLLAENRPARELIKSDWTMMNDILARHYGYSGITGGQLRPVTLRAHDPRGGGLLGHAGIQSMLCWMGDNWVIYRGAWVLRHVLNAPPPPPPLEVPELIASDEKNRGKSFRELLRQHQEDARCSTCHKNIDPLGFAFQNFDLSGRWRDVEYERYERSELDGKVAWRGIGKTRPVDTSGQLPRGETFQSFAQCKDLIVAHYQEDLVLGLMKNFVIYGVGREPDVQDLSEIRAFIKKHGKNGFPMRDLLKAVVQSRAFVGNDNTVADRLGPVQNDGAQRAKLERN